MVYRRREDFDAVRFFEYGVNEAIARVKQDECGYDKEQ